MSRPILGVDVSKATFHAALLVGESCLQEKFANDTDGFTELKKWMSSNTQEDVWVCIEATGRYSHGLAMDLHTAGLKVSVVNPRYVKHFGESLGSRSKTDPRDARLVAEFCRRMEPRTWKPPTAEVLEFRERVRRREALVAFRASEKTRLQTPGLCDVVKDSIDEVIEKMTEAIETMDELIAGYAAEHETLSRPLELVQSIPGIGAVTASVLVAELGDCSDFADARQVAAYVGVTPVERRSGTSLHAPARMSKSGNRQVRTSLYMATLAAKRSNPIVQQFAQRLARKGKKPKAILGACMRKLIHLVFGVLKHQRPFDPSFAGKNA
jgi:transposase